MAAASRLPDTVAPMLAKLGEPFDSEEHLFEIKWDGIRAVALLDAGETRIRSRRNLEMRERYPELEALRGLPRGVVLDGELVVLKEGLPDFRAVLSREQARQRARIAELVRKTPAFYMVFDLLYQDFEPLLSERLDRRRERLEVLLSRLETPHVLLSETLAGSGLQCFQEACRRNLEGIVAKRRSSRYFPGKRTDAWVKFKRRELAHCLILGFLPEGDRGLRSLLLATDCGGELRYVGRVGSGLTEAMRARLDELLRPRIRATPLVPCPEKGIWVEPGVYCTISYMERTDGGMLRAPVFKELIVE